MAASLTTRTAMSDSSFVPDDPGGEAEAAGEEEDDLPPLEVTVWEDDMVHKLDQGWKCRWCDEIKQTVNHSKALCHVAKTRILGVNVSLCKAVIPPKRLNRYRALLNSKKDKASARKRARERHVADVSATQEAASDALVNFKQRKYSTPRPAVSLPASSSKSGGGRQQGLEAYAVSESNKLVYKSNEADLHMAIADLCHAEGVQFTIGESARFQKVLNLARTVGPNYKPPNRNEIGGELLDLNWKIYSEESNKNLTDEADVFGLAFLGDLATVKRMPLVNVLSSAFNVSVTVLAVKDCTEHLAKGGKKDASYVAGLFLPHLQKHDPQKSRTDVSYFDGAGNVQKAGRILEAHFPRITVLHGAEHCIALFFSDIAKFPEIRVSIFCSFECACFDCIVARSCLTCFTFVACSKDCAKKDQTLIQGLWVWLLPCPARSVQPSCKGGEQRSKGWIAPCLRRSDGGLLLCRTSSAPSEAAIESYC